MSEASLALALASTNAARASEKHPLDRIRMQKAVFLLVQRGADEWKSSYRYEPYNWGPYSSDLNTELRELLYRGELEEAEVPGSRHGAFQTTAQGEVQAAATWASFTPPQQDFVRSVRAYVTSRSFAQLLREVYAEYPTFASKSLFAG